MTNPTPDKDSGLIEGQTPQLKHGPLRQMVHSYGCGLVHASSLALGIALLVIGVLFVSCLFFSPRGMATWAYRYVASSRTDDRVFLTAKLFKVPESTQADARVFIIGTSATLMSTTSDEDLSRRVADLTGKRPDVRVLAAGHLLIWEMAEVAERLPAHFDGVVVFAVSPEIFSVDAESLDDVVQHPNVGFISSDMDAMAKARGLKVPWRSGNFFWDNRAFYLARMGYVLSNVFCATPLEHNPHRFLDRDPLSEQQWLQRFVPEGKQCAVNVRKNMDSCLQVFDEILDHLRRRGNVRVVFMESSMHPRFLHDCLGDDLIQEYREKVQQYVRRQRTEYWDLNPIVGLGPEDFVGTSHLGTREAQARWTNELAKCLAGFLWQSATTRAVHE